MAGIEEFRRLAGVPEPVQERGPRFQTTELEDFLDYALKKLPAFIARGREVAAERNRAEPGAYITRVTGYMIEDLEKAQESLRSVKTVAETGALWTDK